MYLLILFNHDNVFPQCVLWSSDLGYIHEETKNLQGLLLCRNFASGGTDMCESTVHTYTWVEGRHVREHADLG